MDNVRNSIQDFELHLIEDEKAENTINRYITSVTRFFEMYDDISKSNMISFKKEMLESGKSPKTVHNYCVALNQYCQFIGHPEFCVKSIKIHAVSSVENVITMAEYKKLTEGLKNDGNERGYWMISFLAKTGARVSEFVQMTKKSLENGYFELWTKGKVRRIYVPASLIKESSEYFLKQKSELLFANRYGNKMTTRGVSQNIKNWCKKYGIREEVAHPHSFRHLFAIEFLKRNPNISLLADLMGHSSVDTTSIYLKLSVEEQEKQLNKAMNW